MAYVTHRQGLYRTGFRDYGHTNPFAATQLNGMSVDEAVMHGLGRTPFDPEVLHERLGQHHPFPPSGGWGLRGLGDIVPNGSIVTYTGQWNIPTALITLSPSELLAAVTNALSRDGLHVISSSQDSGLLGMVMLVMLEGSFTATLQIQVSNGMGFGQPSDIASIVDHEVFAASGAMPQGSGVSVTSIPGSTPGVPQPGTPDITTWLEQNAVWFGLGLVGLFALRRFL